MIANKKSVSVGCKDKHNFEVQGKDLQSSWHKNLSKQIQIKLSSSVRTHH